MYYLPLAQETYRIDDIRVVYKTEDIVIGQPRLLLRSDILVQIGKNIAGYLKRGYGERRPRCRLRVNAGGVIDKVGVKSAALDLVVGEIFRQLCDDRRDYFLMRELLGAQRSIGNVPQRKFSSKSCVSWALGT